MWPTNQPDLEFPNTMGSYAPKVVIELVRHWAVGRSLLCLAREEASYVSSTPTTAIRS